MKRAVFDTNVVLSALLFKSGSLSWLRTEWASGSLVPVVRPGTVKELLRVLAYPKFRLDPTGRNELLAEYLPFAEWYTGDIPDTPPLCEDSDDQIFLNLAAASRAELLISGDRHILAVADQTPFQVISPSDLSI